MAVRATFRTVATRREYRELSDKQWAELEPILIKQEITPGRTRYDEREVFDTLLFVLWQDSSAHDAYEQGYAPASITSRTLWKWAEEGRLRRAWRTYLKGLSKRDIARWRSLFDKYADSWKDSKSSGQYAARAHSLWFRQMHRVLRTVSR